MKPLSRPKNPCFSSGPCAKRPGWTLKALDGALLGRSHRAKPGRAKIDEVVERSRALLGIPKDYRVAIVPASDTGAIEMAMWSLLGQRGVDVLSWESFGEGWATDVAKQLKLADLKLTRADYGALPDLARVDTDRDVVFTWNGTTSGVCVPNGDWIKRDRQGLTLCDATSAAFAMELPWDKLDVATWSWQKALGGEAAHGMLVLSPRAVARLESYTPPWPLPKIFRLTSKGKFAEGIFKGETINTPSLLAIEDAIDGLKWAEAVGGRPALIARAKSNLAAVADWVERTPWIDFLAQDPASRSWTSVCLKLVDDWFQRLAPEAQRAAVKRLEGLVEGEGAGFDIAGHRDAPPGLRLWCGSTVERADVEALLPWLDWAYGDIRRAAAA
jgi:phosphoserine aminotransferase